ncbi:helix-turn-helix transcriptional regulator [Streptomyces sp. WM6349]|uniref:helix-turn-helix transcriptional regulator n=1 Tax=Streptomyces sp. WM6349 TaxID=1415552 RepID=UPI00099BA263|nr:helix-turn-helix transcriptional regulator [Streptomyces sp. WM6349]
MRPADQPDWILDARRRVGLRIRDARVDANMTQEELAHCAEVDRSTVQRAELGQNDLKLSHLFRIAAALRVPARDLMP